jgi:hypothetical protein
VARRPTGPSSSRSTTTGQDRKLLGTAMSGPRPARPGPAVAPYGPRCSANACRSAIGRPILSDVDRVGCRIHPTTPPEGFP